MKSAKATYTVYNAIDTYTKELIRLVDEGKCSPADATERLHRMEEWLAICERRRDEFPDESPSQREAALNAKRLELFKGLEP